MAGDGTWLLAWDLSAPRGILVLDGHGTTLQREIAGATRVSHLFVAAGELLASAGATPAAIGLLGVARGPGSFTGVRVAVTAGKVLAAALHVPLVAPDSLKVLAAGAEAEYVFAAIDARRGEVYNALYRVEHGCPDVLSEPCVISPTAGAAALRAWMEREGRGAVGVGNGVEAYRDTWPEGLIRAEDDHPRAEGLVAMCRLAWECGGDVGPVELRPLYLRNPDARERCRDTAPGGGSC